MLALIKKQKKYMAVVMFVFSIALTIYAQEALPCKMCTQVGNEWTCTVLTLPGNNTGWSDCDISDVQIEGVWYSECTNVGLRVSCAGQA